MIEQDKQLEILNKATDKALTEVGKKRKGKKNDFIAEFHDWYKLVTKYLKQMLNN